VEDQTLLIRETTAQELSQVEELLLAAYGQYAQCISEELWNGYRDDMIHNVRESNTWHKLHAEYGGEIVGSVFLYQSALNAYESVDLTVEEPFIRLLAVHPSVRGKGVATALIRESARIAASHGASNLFLHTSDIMADAVRLYEKLGFERVPEHEHYSGDILVKCYKIALHSADWLQEA